MDNIKNDPYYANRIREDLTFIVTHMKGNVDLDIVFTTLKTDIPELLVTINQSID